MLSWLDENLCVFILRFSDLERELDPLVWGLRGILYLFTFIIVCDSQEFRTKLREDQKTRTFWDGQSRNDCG